MNKKKLAIALLIISVVGFVLSQNIKKKYLVYEERTSGGSEFSKEFYVAEGNAYMFSVWGTDEESGIKKWANLEASVLLLNSEQKVIQEKQIVASGNSEDTGISRATNGYDIRYNPEKSETIILKSNLVRGDYLDIVVYENLPENAYWFPVLFIAIFLAGLVLFLKARNQEKSIVNT